MTYRTILVDPPWPQRQVGRYADTRHGRPDALPYPTMTIEDIAGLPVGKLADQDAHLWLWTTNQFLPDAFPLIERWGFRYMTTTTWAKPSGLGAWWVSRTQHLIFAYRGKLDMASRYHPTVYAYTPKRHSQKPDESYTLIEAVSHPARVELFARTPRPGWASLGNEIDGRDITAAISAVTDYLPA